MLCSATVTHALTLAARSYVLLVAYNAHIESDLHLVMFSLKEEQEES